MNKASDDNGAITERTKIPLKLVTWLIGIILTAASGLSGAVIAGVMKDSQIGERLQMVEIKISHLSEMVQVRLEAEEVRTRAAIIELRLNNVQMLSDAKQSLRDGLISQWERFRWFLALTAEMNDLKLPEDPARGLGNPPAQAEKGGGT